ncbi:MAG TPA: SAM-dependent methyltransferase [Blastocatellia bacterium]|nr:SAM-dependent methyltransferase [Blastocatellia bacterium]HMX27803.1 SAM-dependent methyltransferase [Blastocatellia bacterium]HNG29263.1 SAM-dependent methyltransferase [Blastocatellia bacterium]
MIELQAIGIVHNTRRQVEDDNWGGIVSEIEVLDPIGAEGLAGIEDFSHAEVIFYFHQVEEQKIVTGARHPRNNPAWPRVGILAQRGKNRPNRLGLAVVRIVRREENKLYVEGLDAIDGTPVLDIKPLIREFLPQGDVRQPEWATEIMKNYWHQHPQE